MIITLALYISGATFTMVDIGTDSLLVWEYVQKTIAYQEIIASNSKNQAWKRCDDIANSKLPDCWIIISNESQPNGSFSNGSVSPHQDSVEQFDESWTRNQERAPLGKDTLLITILTGSWIGLGGLLQLTVFLFLNCRSKPDGPFQSLPFLIRVLILITSPFLLSPIVLHLYGAYVLIFFGKNDIIKKIPLVMSALSIAETVLESIPQMVTQYTAMLLNASRYPSSSLNLTQLFSVGTSTLSIVSVIVKFISLQRGKYFISRRHPVPASMVAISMLILSSVVSGSLGSITSITNWQFYFLYGPPWNVPVIATSTFVFAAAASNAIPMLFILLIIMLPFDNRKWMIIRSFIYFFLSSFCTAMNVWTAVEGKLLFFIE